MQQEKRLALALLFMRLTVFLVMFMWTLDKFLTPAHAASVFEKYYFIGGMSHVGLYILAGIEMVILLGFLLGYLKRLTYGFVLIFHAISTVSVFNQYLDPYTGAHLLFFAAWPMLAACFALYYLRDADKYTLGKTK